MIDAISWEQNNEAFLVAALNWLRLCLVRLVEANVPTPIVSEASVASTGRAFKVFRRPSRPAITEVGNRPKEPISQEAVTAAKAEMNQAITSESAPALILLAQRFDLSEFEKNVLLLCVAMELDTRIANLCAQAQDDLQRPYPTFALAMALFENPAWDVLSPERPLRFWRLIEINQPDSRPLTTSVLKADERIVNYVKGLNYLDDRLNPLFVPLDISLSQNQMLPLPPSQQSAVHLITSHLAQWSPAAGTTLIQLLGADSPSKQMIALQATIDLGLHLYRLPAELLPANVAELETFLRLWQRESVLLPIVLYLDASRLESGNSTEGPVSAINRFISRGNSVIFLDIRDVRPELGRSTLSIDVARPTPQEQYTAWVEVLGADGRSSSSHLAGQFDLNLVTISTLR